MRERVGWLAFSLALAALAGWLGLFRSRPATRRPPVAHFAFDAAAAREGAQQPDRLSIQIPALSPDGRSLVFNGGPDETGDRGRLWIRSLDSLEARALPGTEGGITAFWSPDGSSLAFLAGGMLKRLSLGRGAARDICRVPPPSALMGGDWNPSGTIVFASVSSLFTVDAGGGDPKLLAAPDASRGEIWYRWPHFLPDGRRLAYTASGAQPGLYFSSLDAPDRRRLVVPGAARMRYVPPGFVLRSQNGMLSVQRFDANRQAVVGDPVPIASSVLTPFGFGGSWSVSPTGVLAWRDYGVQTSRLSWRGRDGRSLGELGEERRYGQIALSPDGTRVAAQVTGSGEPEIWIIDVARGIAKPLTTGRNLVWSPDGRELALVDAAGDLVRVTLDTASATNRLVEKIGALGPECWGRDGTLIYSTETLGGRAVWARPAKGDAPPRRVLEGFSPSWFELSPDGRHLAYVSYEGGGGAVYLQPFPDPGERVRVSQGQGRQPLWRGDGRELYYLTPEGLLMAAQVSEGKDGIALSVPTRLMDTRHFGAVIGGGPADSGSRGYAVNADGQRFLFRTASSQKPQQIHVLVNWPSLLEAGTGE